MGAAWLHVCTPLVLNTIWIGRCTLTCSAIGLFTNSRRAIFMHLRWTCGMQSQELCAALLAGTASAARLSSSCSKA